MNIGMPTPSKEHETKCVRGQIRADLHARLRAQAQMIERRSMSHVIQDAIEMYLDAQEE